MIIDSHQHFWKYDPEQFGWIGDDMSMLRRDFLPDELWSLAREVGVGGTVAVQALQTVAETEWLLSLADAHGFLLGVVGWAPLAEPKVESYFERWSANRKFKGVRHIVQAEPDVRFLLWDDFNRGISALGRFGLVYDILIFERQLAVAIEFVDRHPNQVFVLDHLAKPRVRDGALEPWRERIMDLARRGNVYCKLSGLVTEADLRTWTARQLRPYMEIALEAFGPRRLMFGSDWPVCLAATSYRPWFDLAVEFLAPLSEDERRRVLGGTAAEAYKLNPD